MGELKKVGFIVDSLTSCDFSLNLIYNLNKLTYDLKHSVTVFTNKYEVPPANPLFSILNQVEAFSYEGVLISTSLDTTMTLMNCWTSKNRFFYIWDFIYLEDYKKNRDIYSSNKISYITRGSRHKELLLNIWNKNSTIINEFNYEQIRDLVKNC